MDMPCEFSIQSQIAGQTSDRIILECRDHLQLLVRIDIAPTDFLAALLAGKIVTAAFSQGRG